MPEYWIYEWHGHEPPAREPEPAHLRWVHAEPSLVRTLFADQPDRLKVQLEMLDRGYVGLLCLNGDEWGAFAWMRPPHAPGPSHLPREVRQLPCYWITYCRTKEGFRRQGLFTTAILKHVATARAERPDARILIDVEPGNIASRRAVELAGFARAGHVKTVSVGVPRIGHVVLGSWRSD